MYVDGTCWATSMIFKIAKILDSVMLCIQFAAEQAYVPLTPLTFLIYMTQKLRVARCASTY